MIRHINTQNKWCLHTHTVQIRPFVSCKSVFFIIFIICRLYNQTVRIEPFLCKSVSSYFHSRGEREWHLGIREREWIIPFPEFGNGKGIEKIHSLNSGTGREWKKTFPKLGMGRERKNLFPKFVNGKGMKKIHSHNPGMGIRGYHSQEYQGTGTGMKKHNMTIKENYLANMWREKEFWPILLRSW